MKNINAAVMGLSIADIIAATGPKAFVSTSNRPDRYQRTWQTLELETPIGAWSKVTDAIVRVPEFRFYLPNMDSAKTDASMERVAYDNFLEVKSFMLQEFRRVKAEAAVTEMLAEVAKEKVSSTEEARAMWEGWDAVPEAFKLILLNFDPAEATLLNDAAQLVHSLTPDVAAQCLGAVAKYGHILNTQEERRRTNETGGFAGEERAGHYLVSGVVRCWWRNRRTTEAPETAADFVGMRTVMYEADLSRGEYASLDQSGRSLRWDCMARANDVLLSAALNASGIEIEFRDQAQQERRLSAVEAEHRAAMETDRLAKKRS